MQAGYRQHVRKPRIAQRLEDILGYAAAFTGDQGGRDSTRAAGKHGCDAVLNSVPQPIDADVTCNVNGGSGAALNGFGGANAYPTAPSPE